MTFSATVTKDRLHIIPLQDPLGLIGNELELISAFTDEQKDHSNSDCALEQQKTISEVVSRLKGPADKNCRRSIEAN
jgi:hypothetical protein